MTLFTKIINGWKLKAVNHFFKKLHLRCLTGFWICLLQMFRRIHIFVTNVLFLFVIIYSLKNWNNAWTEFCVLLCVTVNRIIRKMAVWHEQSPKAIATEAFQKSSNNWGTNYGWGKWSYVFNLIVANLTHLFQHCFNNSDRMT